jgi:hypothetical protein
MTESGKDKLIVFVMVAIGSVAAFAIHRTPIFWWRGGRRRWP